MGRPAPPDCYRTCSRKHVCSAMFRADGREGDGDEGHAAVDVAPDLLRRRGRGKIAVEASGGARAARRRLTGGGEGARRPCCLCTGMARKSV